MLEALNELARQINQLAAKANELKALADPNLESIADAKIAELQAAFAECQNHRHVQRQRIGELLKLIDEALGNFRVKDGVPPMLPANVKVHLVVPEDWIGKANAELLKVFD